MEEQKMELETLREFFEAMEDGKLTYQQFMEACRDGGLKLVDLSEGGYVSKQKYEDELQAAKDEVSTLNETLSTRDNDLAELQSKLEAAGTDAEKLTTLSNDFTSLKTKYDNEVKEYKSQLKKQAYEFAVKEFAADKQFSSNAAKRDFINSMIKKDLKMEDGIIIGAEDFVKMYSKDNEDAFVVEDEGNDDAYEAPDMPHFVDATSGPDNYFADPTGGFASAMNFTPIHPMPTE